MTNGKLLGEPVITTALESDSDDVLPDLLPNNVLPTNPVENDAITVEFAQTLAQCMRVAISGSFDGDMSGCVQAEQIMTDFLITRCSRAQFWACASMWLKRAVDVGPNRAVPCVAALRGCGADWPPIVGPQERESWRRQLRLYRQAVDEWKRQENEIQVDDAFDVSF